jgi:copper(I)-binding protein
VRRSLLLIALVTTSCGETAKPGVTDAQVNLPAVTGHPGVAYFTLKGGPSEMRLMSVTSPSVVKIEMHDMVMNGDMMSMPALDGGVAVPAGGEVRFAPMGKHAMLFDVNPKLKVGDTMKLSFTYADGLKIDTVAKVRAPGDVEVSSEPAH